MKLLYVFYISGSLQSKHQHKYKNIYFYYADKQKQNLKINNILYIVNTPTCFSASALSSGSLNLVMC